MRPASSIETLPAVGVWRLRSVGLVLAIVIAAAFVPGRLAAALAVNARDAQQDFGIFYRGAHCLHDAGCDPYGGADQSAPNLAPPHAHLLLAPVIWLSRPAAYAAWLALSVFILAIVIIRVTRQLSMSFTPLGWLLIAMIVAGS